MIDCHSHILPGLDDGARNTKACLDMCHRAIEDGVTHVIATPHHGNGLYTTAPETVQRMVDKLNDYITKQSLPLTIHPGCEAHLSPQLLESVEAGQTQTICGGPYLLLELPVQELPIGLEQFVFNLIVRDIQPIIAHPERIDAVQRNPEVLLSLVRSGALVQLTGMSITGEFGPEAQTCAETLLTRRMVHIIASDAHSLNRRPPVLSEAVEAAAEILGSEAEAREMVFDIPARVLRGEPFDPPTPFEVLPPPPKRGFWSFMRGFV